MSGGGDPRQRLIAVAMKWWKSTGGRVADPGGGLHHQQKRKNPIQSLEYALCYACAEVAKAKKEQPK